MSLLVSIIYVLIRNTLNRPLMITDYGNKFWENEETLFLSYKLLEYVWTPHQEISLSGKNKSLYFLHPIFNIKYREYSNITHLGHIKSNFAHSFVLISKRLVQFCVATFVEITVVKSERQSL